MRFETRYMDDAVYDLGRVIEEARAALADVDFDTIVGTGFSGAIAIPSLALALGKKFVLIRKETDDSHHGKGRPVGELGKRWIFVDDFVSSGRTRKRVIEKIDKAILDAFFPVDPVPVMVGQYLYMGRRIGEPPTFDPYDASWSF